jgi:hypothetical protein
MEDAPETGLSRVPANMFAVIEKIPSEQDQTLADNAKLQLIKTLFSSIVLGSVKGAVYQRSRSETKG